MQRSVISGRGSVYSLVIQPTDPCSLQLLRFLVRLVLPAALTKLLELETACGRLFVLRRRVVPLLALGALQCDNFPHFQTLQFTVLSS